MGFPSATMDHPGSSLLGADQGLLTFRVCSPEHRGRVLRIRSPKCTIGTATNCTLRLRAAGVRPLHCVVLHGRQGTVIRRWSGAIHVNGEAVEECWLQPGDRLYVGPIELEYLGHDAPSVALRSGDDAQSSQPVRPAVAAESTPAAQSPAAGVKSGDEGEPRASSQIGQQALGDSMDRLRGELADVKQQHAQQLAEQRALMDHAAAAERQLRELTAELKAVREAAAASRSESQQQAAQQLEQRDAAERDRQEEQLQQLRAQLDEAAEKLLAAEDWATRLQTQLEQTQSELRRARRARNRRRKSASWTTSCRPPRPSWRRNKKRWEQERDSWDGDTLQLRQQLDEATKRLQEATQSLNAAKQRSAELEALLAETSEELSQRDQAACSHQRENGDVTHELAQCRELVDSARKELQQERDEHQRVRSEWHAERQNLQKELAERSQTLDELQAVHAERMEEAEFLIQSLQREGKQLLSQLDEAKQELRRDHEQPCGRKPARPAPATPMVTQPFDTPAAAALRDKERAGAEEQPAGNPTPQGATAEPADDFTATLVLGAQEDDAHEAPAAEHEAPQRSRKCPQRSRKCNTARSRRMLRSAPRPC